MQADQTNEKDQRGDIFFRPSVSTADCTKLTDKNQDVEKKISFQ